MQLEQLRLIDSIIDSVGCYLDRAYATADQIEESAISCKYIEHISDIQFEVESLRMTLSDEIEEEEKWQAM